MLGHQAGLMEWNPQTAKKVEKFYSFGKVLNLGKKKQEYSYRPSTYVCVHLFLPI